MPNAKANIYPDKILVLYEELAWYLVNCLNELAEHYSCKILVVCKKPNQVAPFQYSFIHPRIEIVEREDLSKEELYRRAAEYGSAGIFVGGWSHKPYLELLKKLRPKVAVIGFDNSWTGSLKQRMGAIYFRMAMKPYLHYAFVPGAPQVSFAKQLGFDAEHIVQGIYCCDHALFAGYHQKFENEKSSSFPKRFLYSGRYAKEKGVEDLWSAFIQWQEESPNEWELWCLGKGDLESPVHPKIRHFGFVQANAMDEIIKNTGVFILPSSFEPWGVVVHEYAAAGYPLICSDKVGAASAFLEEGRNGFSVKAGNVQQLKEKMNKFSTLNEADLQAMSRHSVRLAERITPAMWAQRFMKMFGK